MAHFFHNSNFSQEKRDFIRHLSFSLSGGFIAYILLFIASVFAARFLGPEEFGRFAIVYAIGNSLAVFFVLGLDGGVTHLVAKGTQRQKQDLMTASLQIFSTLFLAVTVLFIIFAPSALLHESITKEFLVFGYALGVSIALKKIFDTYLRGSARFSQQALFKVIEGVGVIGLILLSVTLFTPFSYTQYALVVIVSGALFSIMSFFALKSELFTTQRRGRMTREILSYVPHGSVNSIVDMITTHLDKILVAVAIGYSATGIYAVYTTVSILLIARVLQLFINVFLPAVSKTKKKKQSFHSINIFLLRAILPGFVLALLSLRLMLEFFGKAYPIEWMWIGILSAYIVAYSVSMFYQWFLVGFSRRGANLQAKSIAIATGIFVCCIALFIATKAVTITLIFFALLIYRTLTAVLYFYFAKRMIESNQ